MKSEGRASKRASVPIVIEPQGWDDHTSGNAIIFVQDIKKVLESTTEQIWQYCPNTKIDHILVYHSAKGPLANFQRDAKGRIRIGLDVKGRGYCKFAYQFAHEFCHVIATQSNDSTLLWQETNHANQWFEECICETASIFAIRRMGLAWQTQAPFPHWTSYASDLSDYVDKHLKKQEHQLPSNTNFLDWFSQQETEFRANPIAHVSEKVLKDRLRAKFVIVASQLLSLFENEPSGWEAITFINRVPQILGKSLTQQITDWHSACPDLHQPFVQKIGTLFGIQP